MRAGDLCADRLNQAASYGMASELVDDAPVLPIQTEARVQRLLDEAPRIAAAGDPALVPATRTSRGALSVVRLHAEGWSLVMTAGRPIPAVLFVFLDDVDEPGPWNIRDPDWLPELAAMSHAVLSAVDT